MTAPSPLRDGLSRIPQLARSVLRPGWRLVVDLSCYLADDVRPAMAWIGTSVVLLTLATAAQAALEERLPPGFWYVAAALPLLLFTSDWYREMTREPRPRFEPLWSAWARPHPREETPLAPPAHGPELANSYGILGVTPGAPTPEVKAAYRRLVKRWHPDRFTHSPAEQARATDTLRAVIQAYRRVQSRDLETRRGPRGHAPRSVRSLDRSGWMFATALILGGLTVLYVASPPALAVVGSVCMIALL